MKTNNIIIVGGGSAGWMTAATLIKSFPNKKITLIESPKIETISVGESTIGFVRYWTHYLGIKDEEFFKATDATYKLSIRFEDFYKKGDGGFHYPFGPANFDGNQANYNDWVFKKYLYPKTHRSDFATCLYPQMALVNNNKLCDNENSNFPFNFIDCSAYHFDAAKFGLFLRDSICIPNGVKHIKEDIKSVETNEEGIKSLNNKYRADLFIDCTGFKSLLLSKTLKEPFESLTDILPNNSAWATKIKYKNPEKEMVGYTNCHAIENGWCWEIPLWHRWGTGYVYSDKFVDNENALKEFKRHIKKRFPYANPEELEYRNIKMRVGIHNRLWVKNVVAIGLAAAFTEPLESNGLFTTHEFLMKLVRTMQRGKISQWEKDNFTYQCKTVFENLAEFVGLHYALSIRDDTPYWKHCLNKQWEEKLINLKPSNSLGYLELIQGKAFQYSYQNNLAGIPPIAFGMDYYPTDIPTIKYFNHLNEQQIKDRYIPVVDRLNKKSKIWNKMVKDMESFYQYHKRRFYK